MHPPLNKIPKDKHGQQLCPYRPGVDLYGDKVLDTEQAQELVKCIYDHIGSCVVNDQREKEKIKEHVKEIQPEILPELWLVLSPWR
jgi:hypothetical protein